MAIAGALQAPVVHALRGKEFVEYDNPYDVGMTGLLGFSSGYRAMEHCETLLMLGTDFPYRQFYPDGRHGPPGRRPRRADRPAHAVDIALVGTVKDTIQALLPRLTPKTDAHTSSDTVKHYGGPARIWTSSRTTTATALRCTRSSSPRRSTGSPSEDAIFLADVGTPAIWAARYLHMNGKRRLIGSFNHGSMANALPQAIGAQASQPGRQVVTLSGDGGLAMLLGELLTLRAAESAGESRRLQQRCARVRRARDEGRRHRQLRHGSRKSKLRRDRSADRPVR